jgi:hypothetical protein
MTYPTLLELLEVEEEDTLLVEDKLLVEDEPLLEDDDEEVPDLVLELVKSDVEEVKVTAVVVPLMEKGAPI